MTGIARAASTSTLTVAAADNRGFTQTSLVTLAVVPSNYTILDQGSGTITTVGDRYLYVGAKLILWDSSTKLKSRGGQFAVGMTVQWKGKRDVTTGAVLASQLTVN